jgi:hypothetical protein
MLNLVIVLTLILVILVIRDMNPLFFHTAEELVVGDEAEIRREAQPLAIDQQVPTINQVTPPADQPNTDAGTSSGPPVPGILADMLQDLGTSFRRIQRIPGFDPEQMIAWMLSSLSSMNMVCYHKNILYTVCC